MTRIQFLAGAMMGFFLFATASRAALGPTQPHIQWISGTPCLGVQWLGGEADN